MAKILLIEDDSALQDAYKFVLQVRGHIVASAFNGKEGLALAEKDTFDVILLDIHMPVMNGLEFLKQYSDKKQPETKIIVFSNMVDQEIDKQVSGLGADRTILKSSVTPTNILDLIKEVTEY